MALAGEKDKSLDPLDVRLFRPIAVVPPPYSVAHAIE
jgi:hypothetical protein